VDVSNPAAPVEAAYYNTPGYANGVAVAGGRVYIADQHGGLVIVRHVPYRVWLPLVVR
jgi:hypothetical protein